MRELERLLVSHLEANGPIGFDDYQAQALYAPGLGFYATGHGAGRRRDFLTSPEVGPLFGAVIGRALDTWWAEMGEPATFTVVEAGAGPGTLARSILAAAPRCAGALDLVLVEVSDAQRGSHPAGVRSRPDLPAPDELGGGPTVVLANELLDNLPVALAERGADGWSEVRVGAAGGRLVEVLGPLVPEQIDWCDALVPDAAIGARIPVQADDAAWVLDALALAGTGGRVVAIDYARSTTAVFAQRPQREWLRTYADHGRATDPYADPGSADITCDIAVDQLGLVASPATVRTQAAFLRQHGIDELVAEGRARWDELGLSGGLAAIEARSRVSEAAALLDPDGLGGFTVVEWLP